jgi:hypothetical protein
MIGVSRASHPLPPIAGDAPKRKMTADSLQKQFGAAPKAVRKETGAPVDPLY